MNKKLIISSVIIFCVGGYLVFNAGYSSSPMTMFDNSNTGLWEVTTKYTFISKGKDNLTDTKVLKVCFTPELIKKSKSDYVQNKLGLSEFNCQAKKTLTNESEGIFSLLCEKSQVTKKENKEEVLEIKSIIDGSIKSTPEYSVLDFKNILTNNRGDSKTIIVHTESKKIDECK